MLATISVITTDNQGTKITLRALCDGGSQISLITTDIVRRLKLRKLPNQVNISGVNGSESAKGQVTIALTSTTDNTVCESMQMLITSKIPRFLPQKPLPIDRWPHIRKLQLADKQFHIPSNVDLLLGADFYSRIIRNGLVRHPNSPVAQNTTFGWIVFGETDGLSFDSITSQCLCIQPDNQIDNNNLSKLLTRFWELEALPQRNFRSSEEERCEQLFINTVTRDQSGKYIVQIPFKPNAPAIIDSRHMAFIRMRQMHKRFERDPELQSNYQKFMTEYEDLDHMELVPEQENDDPSAIYIPHHSATGAKKFRVVFDGSCKGRNGISINDIQLNGERLQPEITTTIMKFRYHRIALCADIVKMYRQILVPKEQRDLQRILYSESFAHPIREYRLKTQTYGLKSAAYSCVRALRHCGDEHESTHPRAANVIKNSFYVDDMMHGEHDERAAISIYHELNEVLDSRGLHLAKWSTNNSIVNQAINGTDERTIEFDKDDTNAVLGLNWRPSKDVFYFKIKNPPEVNKITKRSVVADIARLYDPIGYLSPTILLAKVIIQDLWRSKIDWDEEIRDDHENGMKSASTWNSFRNQLPNVEQIEIPRWIGVNVSSQKQLHGFADASQYAYGIAFYVRVENIDHTIQSNLVFSKTRVAPIRTATIPRLELCSAYILAELLEDVRKAHDITIDKCVLWSDSMVALQWIAKSPAQLQTFQAQRVSTIQEKTEGANWRHINTKDNPADLASRGVTANKLINNHLWWHGPKWLLESSDKWPKPRLTIEPRELESIESAIKKPKLIAAIVTTNEIPTITNDNGSLLMEYSSWTKLTRVTAYVLKFIRILRTRKRTGPKLTINEILEAECFWIKHSQQLNFAKEIAACNQKMPITKESPLSKLTPFVDKDGILRASGRIKRSGMSYDENHPIILTGRCNIVQLLAHSAHKTMLHGGMQLCLQYLRNRYWIIGIRFVLKKVIRSCLPCFRQRKETAEQLMGQLPESRITPGRAFIDTSVDYAGPMLIKRYSGRTRVVDKGYIAVFVCDKTRAIHLELVSNLTSEAFIAAFTRFVSRRGRVRQIRSDNATNFHGADNDHREILHSWQKSASNDWLQSQAISWIYIPPVAPHMGGLHEAAVKSTKHHLRRVIGTQQLTFEQMATLLTQIEACLNSRPLCSLNDEQEEGLALTPGHFLIGEPLVTPLARDYTNTPKNRLSHFKLIEKMSQEFWQRWSEEYIKTLIPREKWYHSQQNLAKDDIVLVTQENFPPTKWPIGRIMEVYPGEDGIVRSAEVLFNDGIYKRPIARLCPLPTS